MNTIESPATFHIINVDTLRSAAERAQAEIDRTTKMVEYATKLREKHIRQRNAAMAILGFVEEQKK